jgi:hypothetical protein
MEHRPSSEADSSTDVSEFHGINGTRNLIVFFTGVPEWT